MHSKTLSVTVLHEPSGNGEVKADTIDGRHFSTQKAFHDFDVSACYHGCILYSRRGIRFWVSFLSLRLGHPFRSYDTSTPSSPRPLFSGCRVYIPPVFVLEPLDIMRACFFFCKNSNDLV